MAQVCETGAEYDGVGFEVAAVAEFETVSGIPDGEGVGFDFDLLVDVSPVELENGMGGEEKKAQVRVSCSCYIPIPSRSWLKRLHPCNGRPASR